VGVEDSKCFTARKPQSNLLKTIHIILWKDEIYLLQLGMKLSVYLDSN
jgi:hypothetical protein